MIDHLYVTNTTYVLNSIKVGNGFSEPFAKGDLYKLIVIGMDENGAEAGRKEVVLAKDDAMRSKAGRRWTSPRSERC